jgi:hypothetical protein
MYRALLLPVVLSGLVALLTACDNKHERPDPPVDVALLSTDLYVRVADHELTFPVVAVDDPSAYTLYPKSLLTRLVKDATAPQKAVALDSIELNVRSYGLNDFSWDEQRKLCPLLSRKWALAVCDNPWSAIQQALPGHRFWLVDLSALQIGDRAGPAACLDDGKPRRSAPMNVDEPVMVCRADVQGAREDQVHYAVIRIDADLGALWMVSRFNSNGETAEASAQREGKAITAFVKHAIGQSENFSALHAQMCRLRRPGAVDGPGKRDCQGAY